MTGFFVAIGALIVGALWLMFSSGGAPILGAAIGSVGGNLTAAQIAQYAASAGFAGNDLINAIAVAIAESSGNPSAEGDTTLAPTRGPSLGLWQINIGSLAHPEYASANLFDPQTNANAAFAVYSSAGGSFSPWSTFKSGAYQAYLPQAEQAVSA